MASIETLLENSFEPTRSVVLSFGFDEEASGLYVRMMSLYHFIMINPIISGCGRASQILVISIWEEWLCSSRR